MASRADYQLASLAAGFTIGFGFLTVWEAIKQTRRNRNPLGSAYIYMIWGEILANLIIAIVAWLFLDGVLGPTVPVLFFILFLWVWEIQLLMQIIINRIAIIRESQETIVFMKWGIALAITLINIAVFVIWIPAHLNPPASQTFVTINHYWDRVSKILILLVDAGLNWYFLSVVKTRLVDQHGLLKYKPLVGFNAKLMILSIAMDAMLIGLMSLPNQVVYIQFHPVAYMVKLNIEMSMASLITRLSKDREGGSGLHSPSYLHGQSSSRRTGLALDDSPLGHETSGLKRFRKASIGSVPENRNVDSTRSHRMNDLNTRIDLPNSPGILAFSGRQDDVASGRSFYKLDEIDSSTSNARHPEIYEKET
ncbi:hypothetical protein CGRA01v4_13044 [Colletotrichum graminicola]|uniref:Integral membrane protein n=1 Tax=Colletotrichum graminicola (strain M1.001 / M2 / FGSC 10212) TaxID=645133 RepID=E3QLZ3_COLGM|nr:uncharacterized protein GLRG_07025 [Colletotrichum graminicola M1.001]EFQ31881.1 hypothetical protein GLRG_07025 [Colletotrichum graminicola M1.001]WDK21754.1 hypothetical protein CGRA01v4_13044 [Colletotrichum graminicola]